MINDLLDRLEELELVWMVLLAFFLPFGETVAFLDFLVPGEVGMVLVGAAAGTPERITVVYIAGTLGAFCGDSVSWYIGHRWGVRVLSRFPRLWRRMEHEVDRATEYFERHGGRTVFFARFVGALRAVAPLAAGTAGMPYRRFAPWNAAASVIWVGLMITLGVAFGDDIADFVDRFSIVLSLVVVGLLVAFYLRSRRRAGSV